MKKYLLVGLICLPGLLPAGLAWAQGDDEPQPAPEVAVEAPAPAPAEAPVPAETPAPAEAPAAAPPAAEAPSPEPQQAGDAPAAEEPRSAVPAASAEAAPPQPRSTARNVVRPTRQTPRPGNRAGARSTSPRSHGDDDEPAPAPDEASAGSPAVPGEKSAETGTKVSEKGITFDFEGVGLLEVVQKIAGLTGRNFDVDPSIADTPVTLITHDEIPKEMVYQVLESILATRNFALVETLEGHLVKVVPADQAVTSDKTKLQVNSKEIKGKYDDLSTHVFAVEYADASELATVLKLLGSPLARVDAYAPTNTLIITDTSDGLRRMFSFLDVADIPGFETSTEIFTLEYARAENLAGQLEKVLLDTAAGSRGGATPSAPAAAQRRPQNARGRQNRAVPGQQSPQVIGQREDTLRIVPDERLNSLVVVATEGMMERVRDLVRRLDSPTPYEANNLHVYELMNAPAEQVEQALRPLIGGSSSASTRSARSTSRTAQQGQQRTAQQANARVPASAGGGGQGAVVAFEQQVSVSRYDQTNSLLVVASPQDYKILEAFIARLDVPQRQVLVDAVVMDVTITNDYGVSVNMASVSGNDGFGETDTGSLTSLASSLTSTATAANSIVAGPKTSLMLGVLGQGKEGGMTAGVYEDIKMKVGKSTVKVPFVPLLFQAIETVSDLEVLSRPSLLTADNEEGSIVVGQEVPFITNTSMPTSSSNQQGGYYGGYGYTRVQREEVGVKLTVTPQISEGDNLLLDIQIEVSDVANKGVGDVNVLGPTTNKALMKNKVMVKDGSTAVLAGLIRDITDRTKKQPPVLGDVPGLGWLFRTKSTSMQKRNMVVLVTPHIIKEHIDMDRLTQAKVQSYQEQNTEQLFQQSFFKKVKMKAKARKDYRPTAALSETVSGGGNGENIDSGEIKR